MQKLLGVLKLTCVVGLAQIFWKKLIVPAGIVILQRETIELSKIMVSKTVKLTPALTEIIKMDVSQILSTLQTERQAVSTPAVRPLILMQPPNGSSVIWAFVPELERQ